MSKIAAALFATPPTSTYEETLGLFLAGNVLLLIISRIRFDFFLPFLYFGFLSHKAEDLEPGFYLKNRVMIAKVLLKMKKPAEAKPWLEKVF